jgi:hypothetical protein
MSILLLGAMVGWPLMWATVSVEGTDAFDALSRSYAYTYQRPLRLLWYVLVAFVLAAVSMFVVKLFAASAISLGDWSISWGLGDQRMQQIVRQNVEPEQPLLAPPLVDPTSSAPLFEAPPTTDAAATAAPEASATPDSISSNDNTAPLTGPELVPEGPGTLISIAHNAVTFWKSLLAALTAGYQAGFLFVAAVGVYLLLRKDIDGAEMDEVYVEQEQDFGMPTLENDAATGVPEIAPGGTAQPGDTGATGN